MEPHATEAYGQLLGRDFNPLDLLLLLRTVSVICFTTPETPDRAGCGGNWACRQDTPKQLTLTPFIAFIVDKLGVAKVGGLVAPPHFNTVVDECGLTPPQAEDNRRDRFFWWPLENFDHGPFNSSRCKTMNLYNISGGIGEDLMSAGEERLACAFIQTAVKNPVTFVAVISPEDEMYTSTRESVALKTKAKCDYFAIGRECFKSIENIVEAGGKSFGTVRSFLDFACGYGRVTRYLIEEIQPGRIWVSDIYTGAVDFQVKQFGVNGFYSETEPARLAFPGKFEVIYVGSLFSHLPATRFREWLSTLYSVLDEDGILIFSTHGDSVRPQAMRMDSSGFAFSGNSESGSLSPEEYGSTYVSGSWVSRLAKQIGIANIQLLGRELRGFQDIYVVTKEYGPPLVNLSRSRYPTGNIDSVVATEDGCLSMSGWAMESGSLHPAKEICIYANDKFLGKATYGMPRPDVQEYFGGVDWLHYGWNFKVNRSALREGESENIDLIVIKASIETERGEIAYMFSSEHQ